MKHFQPKTTWATDATYAAGAFPWSGGPNKIIPSLGIQATGAVPNAQVSAQEFNYLENARQDSLTVLGHAALRTWKTVSLPNPGSVYAYVALVGLTPSNTIGAERARIPAIYAKNTSSASRIYYAATYDGLTFDPATPVLTNTSFQSERYFDSGAPGVVFTSSFYSTNNGLAWASLSGAWSPGPVFPIGVHYANLATLGVQRYFVCYYGASVLPYCATPGGVPTNGTFPEGLASGTDAEFANDGLGIVVLLARKSGNAYYSLYRTTDGGATWAKTLDLNGSTYANLTFVQSQGVFAVWTDLGTIRVSADGSSWATTAGTSATVANGFTGITQSLVACGPALVKSVSDSASGFGGSSRYDGVAYSFDLGATWNLTYFGYLSQALVQIRSFNGRIYVIGGNQLLHVSGYLSAPVADF